MSTVHHGTKGKLMYFTNPSKHLEEIFSPRFSKFVTIGLFPLSDDTECKFFLSGLDLTLEKPSQTPKPESKFIIGVTPTGFNFYIIDELNEKSFKGYKLNTHLHFILDPSSISYLRGFLSAFHFEGKYNVVL